METEEDDSQLIIEKLKTDIFGAQREVKSNSNNYDGHVKLISSLSKLYSIYKSHQLKYNLIKAKEEILTAFNKLQNARKSMAAVFPLSIELWIEWIKDELNAPCESLKNNGIEDIFEKAIGDYLGVDIWCLFLDYIINQKHSASSVVREVFEKAIANCGLHYKDGHKIWELYQQFELNLLLETEKNLKEDNNTANIKSYEAQLLDVIKLFKRQMRVPLEKHDELLVRFTDTVTPYLETFKLFSSEALLFKLEDMKSIHEDTLQEICTKSIAIQERNLEENHHSYEAYQGYISHELDANNFNPAIIQCLFERAIVYHCLKSSIWLDYIDFLNGILKQSDLAISVCRRALRNVTWDSRIYIKYMLILEQNLNDIDEIRNSYEMGLEKYSSDGVNYSNVWMSYVSFEKRQCDGKISLIKNKSRIYKLIEMALRHFEGLPEPEKFLIEFMIFWMNIERFWFHNKAKGEIILKYIGIKYRKNSSVWYQVIMLARTIENQYKFLVDDLLDIGLAEFPDSFEQLGQSWLNFENGFGTLNSYNLLEKKINIHLPIYIRPQKIKESRSIKSKVIHQNKFLIAWLNSAENLLFNVEDIQNSSSPISKEFITIPKNEINFSPRKDVNYCEDEGEKRETLKRKYEDLSEESESSSDIIGPVLPPGFLQPKKYETGERKDNTDDSDEGDDNLMPPPRKVRFSETSQQNEKLSDLEKDSHQRTVYVSNLHPATSESDLKIIFGRAGTVQKIDLHRQRGGKIFAFIEYSKPEEAQVAFELEHTPIRNRPVYVSKFNRSKDRQNITLLYSQHQEKNKLFVSNLDKSTTPNDLEKLFNRNGEMASLRLINKKGSSKPFAYVEYKTEDDAARYRNEVNDTIIRGRQIVVEFSNPGRSNQSDKQRHTLFDKSSFKIPQGEEKINNTLVKDTTNRKPAETVSNANVKIQKKSASPFGLVPTQARSQRIQQPLARKPKGPAVRIDVEQIISTKTNEESSIKQEEMSPVVQEHQVPVTSNKNTESFTSKSNDDFRKMLFNP